MGVVHTDARLDKMSQDTFGRNAHYAMLLRPFTPEVRDIIDSEATTAMHVTGKRYSTLLAETAARFGRGDASTRYLDMARREVAEDNFRRNLFI